MNIILINHYAGTPTMGMEFRPYYLAKEWIKAGNDVTIVTASQAHVRSVQPNVSENYTVENIDGIRYVWIKTPEYSGNSVGRILNMFSFVRKLKKYASTIVRNYKPDAVIASSTYPLDIYPAKKIAKKANAKLFFEIHDLWPLSPMELGGYSKYHPFIMVIQYAENFAFKHSDAIISMLPKTLEHTVKHGLKPEKWNHVPNGIIVNNNSNEEQIPDDYTKLFDKLKNEKKFTIGYAGSHGIANSLHTLIETAEILNNNSKFCFIFVGSGPEKLKLIEKAKQLNNVFFLDAIPKVQIQSLLKNIDCLFITLQKSNLFRFGVSPNKMFDYMMAEKPIINAIEAGNDIVKDANCGISVEAENPQALAEAIIKLSEMTDLEKQKLGKNGKNYVIENHDYKKLAINFINILKNEIKLKNG